jgi:hypothetical protein
MRQAYGLKIELHRTEEGELGGTFAISGCFGASEFADMAGVPAEDDAMDFAKNLMRQFERGKPDEGRAFS